MCEDYRRRLKAGRRVLYLINKHRPTVFHQIFGPGRLMVGHRLSLVTFSQWMQVRFLPRPIQERGESEWESGETANIQAVSISVFPFCQVRAAATATAEWWWWRMGQDTRESVFLFAFSSSFITGERAVEVYNKSALCASLLRLVLLHKTDPSNTKALKWHPITVACTSTGLRDCVYHCVKATSILSRTHSKTPASDFHAPRSRSISRANRCSHENLL